MVKLRAPQSRIDATVNGTDLNAVVTLANSPEIDVPTTVPVQVYAPRGVEATTGTVRLTIRARQESLPLPIPELPDTDLPEDSTPDVPLPPAQ